MRSAGRVGLTIAALTLLMVATLPPGALADHTYAHRYYILGRVVDSEGVPVSNVTVRVFMDSGTQAGSGDTEKAYRVFQSDCNGYYGWNVKDRAYIDGSGITHAFLHIHEPRTSGILRVEAVDAPYPLQNQTNYQYPQTENVVASFGVRNDLEVMASASPKVDPVLRAAFVNLQLDEPRVDLRCAGAKERFDRSYTVMGRLMKEIPRENRDGGGIVVSEPIVNAPVSATIRYNNGKVANASGTTTDVGDYLLVLNLSEPLESGEVTLTANGKTATFPADTTFHTTTADASLGEATPWYQQKWFTFVAVAGGIALVVGGAAYFIGRNPKTPASGRRKR